MSPNVATVSYAIAALAFLILFGLLLTLWRGRLYTTTLAFAAGASALWAGNLVWEAASGASIALYSDPLEVLRNGAWSLFLLMALGLFGDEEGGVKPKLKTAVVAIAGFYVLSMLAALLSGQVLLLQLGVGPMTHIFARVAMAVIGMLLVEQLYRNKPIKERWGIKLACLGIGAMFAYDFYLFSDAMLFRKVNVEIWAARGVVQALCVPLIAISASRNPKWSVGLAVSRRVLFHSAALLGSAVYLLAMASAGYYLRFFGGSWGTFMQVAFLAGAVILLAGTLFSGAFRAWLKVFISKHFYSYNYDYREEWMRFTRTLSDAGPGLGERSIQAVAELVESPAGVLWIRHESGHFEPSAYWNCPVLQEREPGNSSFCQFLETRQWVVDLQEYESTPEMYGTMTMPTWLRNLPRAWLVVPLMLHGQLFGYVVLLQPRSAIKLNWEVIDILKIAGAQAASYLAQHDAANALMVARQFESFTRMSTFVVHDLKNLVAQLSLMMANAERHRDNPEFQNDMLETIDLSVKKMKLLLQKLSRTANADRIEPIQLTDLLKQAIVTKAVIDPKPVLQLDVPNALVVADWQRLERVIGHLIQNAIEATPRDGSVVVRLSVEQQNVVVQIEDTGQGMSAEFIRERLFKPFESTKSAGMGIGVFESREYIHELGGRLEVSSVVAQGTVFRVILPAMHSETQIAEHAV